MPALVGTAALALGGQTFTPKRGDRCEPPICRRRARARCCLGSASARRLRPMRRARPFRTLLLAEVLPWPLNLLASYLDRRNAVWREHAQGDANSAGWSPASGKMTEQEAYQILGIAPGASLDEISRAHRSPMKKLHPDQGGTTHLAARINEAKDVLLHRHRCGDSVHARVVCPPLTYPSTRS